MAVSTGAYGNGTYVFIAGGRNGGQIITTPDFNTWNVDFRGPQLTWNSWRSVVYADSKFVIAGETGTILTSVDGSSWASQSSGTILSFLAVTFGNGRYVAVGENGVTATSTDGVNWAASDIGDDNWYWGVAYGNNLFVAVSGSNTIATSTDGVTWVQQQLPVGAQSGWLNDVGWQSNRFVAVGGRDAGGGSIFTSANGTTWTEVTDPDLAFNGWLNGISFDGAHFVAVGTLGQTTAVVLTSTDAIDWSLTQTPVSPSHYGVIHDGIQTIVMGDYGVIATSTDLVTWTRRGDRQLRPETILDIGYANGEYRVVGESGLIAKSTDAASWNILPSPSSGFIRSVAYGNNQWVAANVSNEGLAMLYENGGTWIAGAVPAAVLGTRGVAFGAGKFVALTTTGTDPFIISSDGVNWTAVTTSGLGFYDEIVYDGGVFLAWRNAPEILNTPDTLTIATSADGETWTPVDTGMVGALAYGAEYANGRWVLVGKNISAAQNERSWRVMESANLTSWSEQNLSFDSITSKIGTLSDVTFADGKWVTVGDRHLLWTADDGPTLNWQPTFHTGLDSNLNKFLKVIANGDSFVIAGESPYWDPLAGETATLGEIYQSGVFGTSQPPTLSISPGPGSGQVQLMIQGTAGVSYDILFNEVVPAPANVWQLLETVSLTADSQPFTYTIPNGQDTGNFLLRETQ